MAEIFVGSVAVGVVPSAKGFNEKLRQDLVPGAREIGRKIGEEIARGIVDAIGNPMEAWTRKQVERAPAEGRRIGKAIKDSIKAAIDEGEDPEVKVKADTEPAKEDIRRMREEEEARPIHIRIKAKVERIGSGVSSGLSGLAPALPALGGIAGGAGIGAGVSAALAATAPLLAAGTAVGAFGAVAIPELSKVHAALTKTGAAGKKAWDQLTPNEQVIGLQMKELGKDFKNVQTALQPVIDKVIGLGVRVLDHLMPALQVLAVAGGRVIELFLKPFDRYIQSKAFGTVIDQFAKFAVQAGRLAGPQLVRLLGLFFQLFVKLMPAGMQILGVLLPLLSEMVITLTPVIVVMAEIIAVTLQWLEKNHLLVASLAIVSIAIGIAMGATGLGAIILITVGVMLAIGLLARNWKTIWSHLMQWIYTDFVGKIVHWFTVSLPNAWNQSVRFLNSVFVAPVRTAWINLRNWVWNDFIFKIVGFFTKDLPAAWDASYRFAQRNFVRPVQNILDNLRQWIWNDFIDKIVSFFTRTLPNTWNAATQFLNRNLISPWRTALNDVVNWIDRNVVQRIHSLFTKTIPDAYRSAVNQIKSIWNTMEGIIKAPVQFMVNTVYDKGIVRVVDAIAGVIGKHPLAPIQFASGGIVPGGYSRGDNMLAAVRSGEGILQPGAVSALGGSGFIDWANSRFGDLGGGRNQPGHYQLGGFIHSGLSFLGNAAHSAWSGLTGLVRGAMSGAIGLANNTIVKPLERLIPTENSYIGRVIQQIPGHLMDQVMQFVKADDKAHMGNGPSIVKFAESFISRIPYVWGGTSLSAAGADCSGFTESIYGHFGIRAPRTSEAQGGWVKRSPPAAGGLAFYHSPAGGPDPGHVAIVRDAGSAISQGGGMGPRIIGLHALPLLWTGIPPGGFGMAGAPGHGLIPANAAAIAGFLSGHGANRAAVAGILGNIMQESGGQPGISGGLIQILSDPGGPLGSELSKMLNYINGNGSIADINAHSPDPAAAAVYFSDAYERPGIPQIQRRIASAMASWQAGYDEGGVWPAHSWGVNNLNSPEMVFNPAQWKSIHALAMDGATSAGEIQELRKEVRTLIKVTSRVGRDVGDEINSTGRRSANAR